MSQPCLNCQNETTGRFCPHCGQPTATRRINWVSFFKDFVFNNFTLHQGLLHTLKALIVHPKKMVTEYLAGKRVGYTSAVHFFLFVLIFKGLVSLLLGHPSGQGPGHLVINGNKSDIDLSKYMKPLLLIFVSVSSLGNYLIYRSRKLNLPEHVVVNFYIIGMLLLLSQIFNTVTWYRYEDLGLGLMTLILLSYYIRMFYDRKVGVPDVIRGICCLTVNLLFALIVMVIGAIIYAYTHHLLVIK